MRICEQTQSAPGRTKANSGTGHSNSWAAEVEGHLEAPEDLERALALVLAEVLVSNVPCYEAISGFTMNDRRYHIFINEASN